MYNPTRRSRKIGLTQGGRVKFGKASIKWSKLFTPTTWTKLSDENEETIIIRENPSRDFFHPATRAEIQEVLNKLPAEYTVYVKAVVLRRTPKYDQEMWIEARRRSCCVILNAFSKSLEMEWTSKPTASTIKHMEPWCKNWSNDESKWTLTWTYEEIKNYYLYHLLLHEIGHINQPYFHALKKRESFAEDYAHYWARELRIIGQ